MNIMFLNPNWNLHNRGYTATIPAPMQPLEFCYSAAALKKQHNVRIYDAYLYNSSTKRTLDEIKTFESDVIVMETAPTYCFWRCCPLDIHLPVKICKEIRKKTDAKIIIIGPHPTVTPKWVLKETCADFLIRGEPELSIVEFIKSDFDTNIKGIYTKNDGHGISFIEDISKLPLPAFELLEMKKYKPHTWHQKFFNKIKNKKSTTIEFSRGCPFNCFFCFKKGFREKFRTKKAGQMIKEIRYAKKFNIKYFFFIDEIFNLPSKELDKFLKKLKKEKIIFSAQCRLDVMTEEILQKMVEAGCVHIEWGLETRDKDVLKSLKKDVKINENILSLAEKRIKHNVVGDSSRIYFYTPEVKKILNIEKKTSPISFSSTPIIPFPQTTLYNEIEKMYKLYGQNPWEVAQRFVWYQNMYRIGIRIPFKTILKIPFKYLSYTSSVLTTIFPSRYITSIISGEGRIQKNSLDKLIDKIIELLIKNGKKNI